MQKKQLKPKKKKITKKETKLERERESIDLFAMSNLEGIWQRGGKEVKKKKLLLLLFWLMIG